MEYLQASSSSYLYQSDESFLAEDYVTLDLRTPDTSDSESEISVGEEFPIVPVSFLDARRYVYSNGEEVAEGELKIQLVKNGQVLDMEITANDVVLHDSKHMNTDLQLIGNFGGELTLTRVGIRAKIEYEYSSRLKVKIEVQARKGEAGESDEIKKLYENTVCPQPSQGVAYVDHARTVCTVLPSNFCLELKVQGCGKAVVKSCIVCARFRGGKVSHIDDGEDLVARRLFWK